MEIKKETSRSVMLMKEYHGVCDGCGVQLDYVGDLVIIVISTSTELDIMVPIDRLSCPSCYKELATMRIYKNLEVTKELENLKK